MIEDGCQHCNEMSGIPGLDSLHVPDSFHEHQSEYDWFKNERSPTSLVRKNRLDYWEGLVHFCSAAEFAGIFFEQKIVAHETGYFGESAVCMTEAPIGCWGELKSRHGPFGYVFRKRDIIRDGGGPAWYASEALIKAQCASGGFARDVKPFINLLRIPSASPGKPKHDWLPEREWRMPRDVRFDECEPFAVIIGEFDSRTPNWKLVFKAAHRFQEIDFEESDRPGITDAQ